MTEADLIKEINSLPATDWRVRDILLEIVGQRAGVKPEPPAPARDEFDEAAEREITPTTFYGIRFDVRDMEGLRNIRAAHASALRAVDEKGKAAREKLERIVEAMKEYDQCQGQRVLNEAYCVGRIRAILDGSAVSGL